MRTKVSQIAALILLTASPLTPDDAPRMPGETESSFDFETDEMEGTIRLDGAYHGISRLVDKRTGMQVIDSRYSELNLFKLMSVNQVMGQPPHMDRSITSGPELVKVTWPRTDSHLGELTTRYFVSSPNSIDVTVTVRSQGSYDAAYELFISGRMQRLHP